jgi:hypothetical protein
MANNIFVESPPGSISHTSLSLQLADPGNAIRGVVGHQTETVFPAIAHMVESTRRIRYGRHECYPSSFECRLPDGRESSQLGGG